MFLLNEWWSIYFQKFAPLYFCTEWVSVHDLGTVISQIHFSFSLLIKPTSFLELFFHIMCVGCVHSILICSNTRDRMKSVTLLMRLLLFPQIRNTHCKKRFSYIFNMLLVCFFWQFIKCNHNFRLFLDPVWLKNDTL